MKTGMMLTAVASVLLAGSATAQISVDRERDLHCMALFLTIADSEDPTMMQQGAVGAIYFYGRLQGQDPHEPWLERLGEFSERITTEELNGRSVECADVMRRMGQEMIAFSERYDDGE